MARRKKKQKRSRKRNQSDADRVAVAAQQYQQALQDQASAIREGDRKRVDKASKAANEARTELESLVSSHWEITGAALGATAGGALGAMASGVGGAALGGAGGALLGGFLGSPRVRDGLFTDDEEEDDRTSSVRATRPERGRFGREALASNPKALRKLKNKLLK